MANWVAKQEEKNPQGARVSENTENERIITISEGPSDGGSSPSNILSLSHTEPRPANVETVIWLGGTSVPSGMVDGDYWLRDGEEYSEPVVTDPEPEPVDPVPEEPVDPSAPATHSIWGSEAPEEYPSLITEVDGTPLILATGFYLLADQTDGWRAVGGKVYLPEGTTSPDGTMSLYGPYDEGIPDFDAPAQTVPLTGGSGPGWISAEFSPVEMTSLKYYFVSYKFSNNSYTYGLSVDSYDQYIQAKDGSNLVMMGEIEGYGSARNWFRYDGSEPSQALPKSFYGIDIIVDEGV